MSSQTDSDSAKANGRRSGERRKVQAPISRTDRRKSERRSGDDRRTTPRTA